MLSIIMLRFLRLRDDFIIFIFMTVMTLGLTFVFGMSTGSYRPTVLIVDEDNSSYSKMLVEELSKNTDYRYEVTEYKTAVRKVEEREALTSIVIKNNFEEMIQEGQTPTINMINTKNDMESITVKSILNGISSRMIGNVRIAEATAQYIAMVDKDADKNEVFQNAYNKAVENWKYRRPVEVSNKIIDSSGWSKYDNLKHMMIGFSLFFSMYTIVFGIGEILNERKNNTWQRQIVSPISKISILGGNLLVTYLVGIVQVGILILAGKYLFGIDWGHSIIGILSIVAAFVFAVTCLGLFLSGIVKTPAQLGAVTPVVLTSTSMLGGCMWPLEIINSKILLSLANFVPQKWAIQGMEKIAMYGYSFEAAVVPILVLLAMGIVFFMFGIRLVKFE